MTNLSTSVFVIGCLALIGVAILLASPVTRWLHARHQWKMLLLTYTAAGTFVFLVWGGITWASPLQVYLGIGAVAFALAAGAAADIMRAASGQGLIPMNFGRALLVLVISTLSAICLGRTALELGVTNNSPVIERDVTMVRFKIAYDGREIPATVTTVEERTLDVWVQRHEFWPRVVPYGRGQRFLFPKIEADLPFELYLSTTSPIKQPSIKNGRLVTTVSHSIGDVVMVACAPGTDKCFALRPTSQAYPERTSSLTDTAKPYEWFTFTLNLPEGLRLPRESTLTFKDFSLRPVKSGPLVGTPAEGNIWLLRAWDWFPKRVREGCNNWGKLAEWRLCDISSDTWQAIEANKKKAAR